MTTAHRTMGMLAFFASTFFAGDPTAARAPPPPDAPDQGDAPTQTEDTTRVALEIERLHGLLEEKEEQLQRLERRLSAADDSALYKEASELGVTRAVAAAGLMERSARRLAVAIVREARAHQLDPLLVVAVIQVESNFDAFAVSAKGALGLMQVMPATGEWLASQQGQHLSRFTNLFDFELNLALATSYLADLIGRFGSLEHALVAYNVGPTAARALLADPEASRRWLAGYPAKVQRRLQALHNARTAQARQADHVFLPGALAATSASASGP